MDGKAVDALLFHKFPCYIPRSGPARVFELVKLISPPLPGLARPSTDLALSLSSLQMCQAFQRV